MSARSSGISYLTGASVVEYFKRPICHELFRVRIILIGILCKLKSSIHVFPRGEDKF